MDVTEILIVFGWLPAFIVLTAVDFALLGLILSEIQALRWKHLHSNTQLKIFVRNFAVAIHVKFMENLIENII